jgi:hypothetical protein
LLIKTKKVFLIIIQIAVAVANLSVNFRCRFDSRPRDSSWILGDGGGGGKGAAGTVRVGKEKVRKCQIFLFSVKKASMFIGVRVFILFVSHANFYVVARSC